MEEFFNKDECKDCTRLTEDKFIENFVSACIDIQSEISVFVDKEISEGRMTVEQAVIYSRDMVQKRVPHFQMSLEQVCHLMSQKQAQQLRTLFSQL